MSNYQRRWLCAALFLTAGACSAGRNETTGRQLGRADAGDASEQDAAWEDEPDADTDTDAQVEADADAEQDAGATTRDSAVEDASAMDATPSADAAPGADPDLGPDAASTADADTHADASSDATAPDAGADSEVADSSIDPRPACQGDPASTFVATLRATSDDRVSIYFNGVLVDAPDTNWNVLHEYQVSVFLYPGKRNTIALEARNLWEQGGFDRGVIAELDYTLNNVRRFVNTDTSWLLSTSQVDGYTAPDFDDSSWGHPVSLGKAGISPWSSVPFNTEAEWLWSYSPGGAPQDKLDNDTIYLRKSFYLDDSGEAQPGAPCK